MDRKTVQNQCEVTALVQFRKRHIVTWRTPKALEKLLSTAASYAYEPNRPLQIGVLTVGQILINIGPIVRVTRG